MYFVLKKKYHYILIFAELFNTIFCLCVISDKGLEQKESYNECSNVRWNRRNCVTKYRSVWPGPTTFSCVDSSLHEIYTSNNQVITKTHFIVKNSYLNSLIADEKTWPRLTELTLEKANISSIIPGFFTGFTDLIFLSITHNIITDIDDGVFSTLDSLQNLNLSQNLISHLGTHSFLGLANLQTLDLGKNRISILPTNVFLPLGKLSYLDLSKNMITDIGNTLKLPNLIKLFLRQNDLTEFNFLNVTNKGLKMLDLSHNQIRNVEQLKTVQADYIDLGFNLVQSIQNIGQIRKFVIKNNRIKILQENFVSDSITELDLSFNFITNISSKAFLQSTNLKTLRLDHNNFKELPTNCFEKLEKLEFLDTSYNNITHLEFGTFNNLKNLKILNISHNEAEVDFHAFLKLSNLKNLNFENIYFKNLDQFFFDTHSKLNEMTMSEKSWNCGELAKIIHITELKNISVTKGRTDYSSNIHGISCVSNFESFKSIKNDTKETLDVLSEINSELKTNFFNFRNNTEEKLLNVLNKIEKEIENDDKTFNDNNSAMEKLLKHKQEDETDGKFYVLNLAFINVLLLFVVFLLVIIILKLKKPNNRNFREEIDLLG